ncbi:L,D-transpeptidase family protein [Crenothrix polyspora]|uniref:ErfK/YbiS/YcfS/YnhG family protein n=1 Tax=Crenothrix polyspora TaxID=360316 RepID=A0A1R4H7D7_9GAMM|nr:L,D-transpeptidase family protein [Crenothrix polyspora]SJM91941.1 ErfK/YbiS/YcfS/YnhG family protein [Crenothrix polyspora]
MKIDIKYCTQQLLIVYLLSLPVSPLQAAEQALQETGISKEINTIIAAEQNPYLIRSSFPNRAQDLAALYALAGNQLLWLGTANSEKNINDALTLLANATLYGLNPAHYDVALLQQKLNDALKLNADAYLQQALYDTALSLSVLRFAHDLHYGTVDAKVLNFNLKRRPKKILDLPALIKNSLDLATLAQLPSQVEPKLKQYANLKHALSTYTALASAVTPVKFLVKKNLRIDDEYPQLAELQAFLIALGDLTEDTTTPTAALNTPVSLRYTVKVADAIKKFQYRNGLVTSGILDKNTINALNIPITQRLEQIKLAMERLRWLPEFDAGQAVIVNIPAFQLWAFDDIEAEHSTVLNINVVVGKSLKNQTPVLMADMKFVNFMPYWNVPESILKDEILPKLVNGKSFLAKQNMEIVSNYGNPAKPVPLTKLALDKLNRGVFRVRQRPGKSNALGKVKFIFPNKADVYLHDTPSKALFKKTRRDFSHGCVRVETPEKLAEFVFKNQKGWDKTAIKKAMQHTEMQEVILDKPIPVLLYYSTAFFDSADNLMFYPDIYDKDAPLLTALAKPEDLSDLVIFTPPKKIPETVILDAPTAIETIDTRPAELMQ